MVKYGYHGLDALYLMLMEEQEQEQKDELFRDYVGQTLWVINTIQHLKTTAENDMPQYVELSHPGMIKKAPTAEEIKKDLLKKLGC